MKFGEWTTEITAYDWFVLLVTMTSSAFLLPCVIALLIYVIHAIWAAVPGLTNFTFAAINPAIRVEESRHPGAPREPGLPTRTGGTAQKAADPFAAACP